MFFEYIKDMLTPPFSRRATFVFAFLVPLSAFLYIVSARTIVVSCLSCQTPLLEGPRRHSSHDATPEALNGTNHNLVPNPEGRKIYYDGTGDVPSYQETTRDPHPITPIEGPPLPLDLFYDQLLGITDDEFADDCARCVAGAQVLHRAAINQPVASFVDLLVKLCGDSSAIQSKLYIHHPERCAAQFGHTPNTSDPYSNGGAGLGAYYAQLFAMMGTAGADFSTYCHEQWAVCPEPTLLGLDESLYFEPKPESANIVSSSLGKTVNVLHLSDWHLDTRFSIASEANCTDPGLCCRPYSTNTDFDTVSTGPSFPASRFGSHRCDSPPDLALSAFQSMPQFFNISDLAFTIFTGDIVSHDYHDALSQAYVEYEEQMTYDIFRVALNNVPVYATLGNHDTFPQGLNIQNALNPDITGRNAMSWNYEMLSSLWHNATYLNDTETEQASIHYAAYAHTHPNTNLRIISLNTDMWYKGNIFTYWNTTNPDTSGLLSFLANELKTAESRSQRVWITGHVPSGHDGMQALINPSSLFYSLVVRYSPGTIAGVFFGHTHRQQYQIFYDFLPDSIYTDIDTGVKLRNTSMIDYSKPLMTAFIGPSIVPLTNLNAGYTLYQVDSSTFEVCGMQTFFANISNSLAWKVPVWELEYDTRTSFAPHITHESADLKPGSSWPKHAPLNATFWHKVTEAMERDPTGSVAEMYNRFETKSSAVADGCGEDCARAKICYIRSGSAWLGRRCPRTQMW